MLNAVVDTREVDSALDQLARESGKTSEKVVKESARRVCVSMAVRTRPKSYQAGVKSMATGIRRIYPGRENMAKQLDSRRKDAGKVFFGMIQKNPQGAEAFARSLNVQLNVVENVNKELHLAHKWRKYTGIPQFTRLARTVIKYIDHVAKRVDTAGSGWVEASKAFGPMRYDGESSKLRKTQRAKRPMKVGSGFITTGANGSTATMTNEVDYATTATNTQSMEYALKHELGNLERQIVKAQEANAARRLK